MRSAAVADILFVPPLKVIDLLPVIVNAVAFKSFKVPRLRAVVFNVNEPT